MTRDAEFHSMSNYRDEDLFRGTFEITSIDGVPLVNIELKKEKGFISDDQVVDTYKKMMKQFRQEPEFEQDIEPLLRYPDTVGGDVKTCRYYDLCRDDPFWLANYGLEDEDE